MGLGLVNTLAVVKTGSEVVMKSILRDAYLWPTNGRFISYFLKTDKKFLLCIACIG